MSKKSIAKVISAEEVISSGRVKSLRLATIESASIEMATVRPVGTEYCRILVRKRFLTRAVFFSSARMTPGRPIQVKFRSDISSGAKGYSSGMRIKTRARMAA